MKYWSIILAISLGFATIQTRPLILESHDVSPPDVITSDYFDNVEIQENSSTIEATASDTLADGSHITYDVHFTKNSATASATVDSIQSELDGDYEIDILDGTPTSMHLVVKDPRTGISEVYSEGHGKLQAIPLIIAVPAIAGLLKILFYATATIVIAGVTYLAAEKVIPIIRKAINKSRKTPQHYKATRYRGGIWIGDGLAYSEAVSWLRLGRDTWSATKSGARSLSYSVKGKKPVGPERDGNGSAKYCHYHPYGRNPGSHAFYGSKGSASC